MSCTGSCTGPGPRSRPHRRTLRLLQPPAPLTVATHRSARRLARDHGFAFYDALIVAAARRCGCDTLLSEDMQDGRTVAGLRIVNPFR